LKNSDDKNTWNAIRKNPYEVEFFKQLHAEVKKVSSLFDEAKAELKIRYSRIKVDMEILSNSKKSKAMKQRWTLIERSVYSLHSNLMLLETFAIINYCAFSKILKKHDQKTGYGTKIAFMRNVVNKSNFAAYPDMIAMIQECEALYDKLSQHDGRNDNKNLREEAHLFLGMIQKINTPEVDEKGCKVVSTNKAISQKIVGVTTPGETNSTIINNPNETEILRRNLLQAKRLRSVSENPITDSSTVDGEESNDDDTDACLDYISRKRYVCLTSHQHSKKQRCV